MNSTLKMYYVITTDDIDLLSHDLGLSVTATLAVACHAIETTSNLVGRAKSILTFSENWAKIIDRAIEKVKKNDVSSNMRGQFEKDLKILNEMRNWTYDPTEMGRLAGNCAS